MRRVTLGLILWLAGAGVSQAQITGKVVDPSGDPVAGATVATMWNEGNPVGGTTTDEEGRFTVELRSMARPVAILVMDKEKKRGVLSRYKPAAFDEDRTLKLKEIVEVKGRFVCRELKRKPPWTNVYVNALPEGIRVASCGSREAEFSFLLPPGEYEFHMYGTDVKARNVAREILGGEGVIDLETLNLEASEIAKMYGKAPPRWTVSEARGVEKRVQLADFKGRYVLLEFWGFW